MKHSKKQTRIPAMFGLLFAVLITALFVPVLHGQAIGYRTEFVFHVYVNPLTGDDVKAAAYNPQGNFTPTEALSPHPQNLYGRIQQAPYEFRTVTAAVNYINNTFGLLPWSHSGGTATVEHVVIHCMPGIYAPWSGVEFEPIDPKNGLIYNNETFPINIPDHVSIQGVSALEVIFDGRGREDIYNHIFAFNVPFSEQTTHVGSFIDGITIRNVRSSETALAPDGAGIVIAGESNIQVVISNCIITDCHVGIAIDSYPSSPLTWCHSPILVNNTIAWNWIGIYSGVVGSWGEPFVGYARPRIYNNIIDSRDPDNQFPITSCFEGLDPTDLTINTIDGISVNLDFNAYDHKYNISYPGSNYPPGWTQKPTAVRSASPKYEPRVDLGVYTASGASGVLYINDSFRVSEVSVDNRNSRSPHDFRLSPMAYTPEMENHLNPLVNMGVDTSVGKLEFANYYPPDPQLAPVIIDTPGQPGPGSQGADGAMDLASLHAEDCDLEGFGNPRIETAPLFPSPPEHSTYIDIGADEVGTLIMAGYIDGTRIYSQVDAANIKYPGRTAGFPLGNNTDIYFFNVYTPGNSYPRPEYSQWTSQSFYEGTNLYTGSWWNYFQAVPVVPNADGRYTQGADNSSGVPTARRSLVTQNSWEPFMRSRECDFSPALLPESHPVGIPFFGDAFAFNPWYHHNSALGVNNDNFFIYYSSSIQIAEGMVNPPGTKSWSPMTGFVFTDALHPLIPFFDMQNRGLSSYSVNSWGYGEASLPVDVLESTGWQGRRYNCQYRPDEGVGNLQSFLGVNDSGAYVSDITVTVAKAGKQFEATAVITILTYPTAFPVANATVYISWSGAVSGADSGVTAANGTVTFVSGRARLKGPYTITVNNVTHAVLPYNPALNVETSDSGYY